MKTSPNSWVYIFWIELEVVPETSEYQVITGHHSQRSNSSALLSSTVYPITSWTFVLLWAFAYNWRIMLLRFSLSAAPLWKPTIALKQKREPHLLSAYHERNITFFWLADFGFLPRHIAHPGFVRVSRAFYTLSQNCPPPHPADEQHGFMFPPSRSYIPPSLRRVKWPFFLLLIWKI